MGRSPEHIFADVLVMLETLSKPVAAVSRTVRARWPPGCDQRPIGRTIGNRRQVPQGRLGPWAGDEFRP